MSLRFLRHSPCCRPFNLKGHGTTNGTRVCLVSRSLAWELIPKPRDPSSLRYRLSETIRTYGYACTSRYTWCPYNFEANRFRWRILFFFNSSCDEIMRRSKSGGRIFCERICLISALPAGKKAVLPIIKAAAFASRP